MSNIPRHEPVPATTYDPVARSLHWLIAGLAVIVVALGWAIPGAARETGSREGLLLLHRSIGLLIIALMLARAPLRGLPPAPPLSPRHPPHLWPSAPTDHT